MAGSRVTSINEVKTAVNNENEVFYVNSKVEEFKKGKIRTEGSELFFTPWLPAIRVK